MALTPGTRLGSYEILSPLGQGGMGEVYRARDPRLGREVAIKVLPPAFATSPERLRRFELEARAAAALNHPNILAVYDIGHADGLPFVVSELLHGETLRERLGGGALRVRGALEVAVQVARGLAAAHSKGIVHRDLKPENVFVTQDERVKILDFGLAKLASPEPVAAPSALPTAAPPTETGVVLGTIGYMAPEQVRALPADHRADIFALGAVFYELLSGGPPFQRETSAETMTAILKDEPPQIPAERQVPAAVARIVVRCLEKNPANRFQAASDLAFALESLAGESGAALATPVGIPSRGRRIRLTATIAIASVIAAVAVIVTAAVLWRRRVPDLPTLRLEIVTPPTRDMVSFALSADGRQLVFVAFADGVPRLWMRALDQTTARPLSGTEGATHPFWSPDSRSIGFFQGGKLKRMDLEGGQRQDLADAPDGRGGAWSGEGVILFSPSSTSGLLRVAATGGPAAAVLTDGGTARFPAFLPDGRHFLFFVGPTRSDVQGVYLGSLDSPETRRLSPADVAGAYVVADYLILLRAGVLVALPFDTRRNAIAGEPIAIASAVGLDIGFFRVALAVTPTLLAYHAGPADRRRLLWLDRRGAVVGALGSSDASGLLYPELAPDGQRVAIQRFVEGNFDIWLIDGPRGVWSRFTFDPSIDRAVVWAPDGSRFVFSSNRNGVYDLFEKVSGGAGTDRVLFTSPNSKLPADWAPDGRTLLYVEVSPRTDGDLWALPLTGAPRPFPIVQTRFREDEGQFSPDGRWIAYTSNESGREEVYVQAFPEASGKWQVSTEGGNQPRWRRDGKELFYIGADTKLTAVPIDLRSRQPNVGTPVPLFPTRLASRGARRQLYSASADGRRFLMVVVDDEQPSAITVVQNWIAALKKP